MSELYQRVEEYVDKAFDKDGSKVSLSRKKHSHFVLERIKELKPCADECLLIAAIAHDIDGAFRVPTPGEIKDFNTEEYRRSHQENSAFLIANFLKKQGASKDLVEKVYHIVEKHEDGGDEEQNLLKDADSLGFFDEFTSFFSVFKAEDSEKIKGKVNYMFERITSEKAKELAKPLYEKAIKELENNCRSCLRLRGSGSRSESRNPGDSVSSTE